MRKKFIAALSLALILNSSIFVAASERTYYDEYAIQLSELGVFKGTNAGFELDRAPTRLEGLVMLIRLLGKENDTNALLNQSSVFTDVPSWGKGYVNYAYQNGLTKGLSAQTFGPNEKMDGKSYTTFLLRSLGYSDSSLQNDFNWRNSVDFAKTIGLLDEDLYFKIVSNVFIRDYVAKSSYNALMQPVKDSSSTLIDKLVTMNSITAGQAQKLKSITEVTTTPIATIPEPAPVITPIPVTVIPSPIVTTPVSEQPQQQIQDPVQTPAPTQPEIVKSTVIKLYKGDILIQTSDQPVRNDGAILVTARQTAESLGLSVSWYSAKSAIILTKGSDVLELIIGSTQATFNNNAYPLQVAPQIINERTYIPLRPVVEAFGGQIEITKLDEPGTVLQEQDDRYDVKVNISL